jgi:hypothetical protein
MFMKRRIYQLWALILLLPGLAVSVDSGAQAGTGRSAGDVAHETDKARSYFGVGGTGVTVGVIAGSYNCQNGATDDVTRGALPGPGNVNATPVVVLAEGNCTSGYSVDEGRAMLQVIHDIAPEAELLFYSGTGGRESLAAGVEALRAAGADVIADGVVYFTEPYFQDGMLSQAVDAAVADGVVYFTAAGNWADESYESDFRNSGQQMTLDVGGGRRQIIPDLHDFDPNPEQVDVTQSFTLAAGAQVTILFQWSNASSAVSSNRGAAADLDIHLTDADSTIVVAGSAISESEGVPAESFTFRNPSSTESRRYDLYISLASGPAPERIKYIRPSSVNNQTITDDEYPLSSSTIFGHLNAAGAAAVGAAFYQQAPFYQPDDAAVIEPQPYSSQGGTEIRFDVSGNAVDPVVRRQPRFTAVDGVNTTLYGSDIPGDDDTLPNFFGTSASAAHAAGIAALLLQADSTQSITPEEVYTRLADTAIDMTDSPGFDFKTGAGLLNGLQAVSSETTVWHRNMQPVQPGDTLNFGIVNQGSSAQERIIIENTGIADLRIRDVSVSGDFMLRTAPEHPITRADAASLVVGCNTDNTGIHRGTLTFETNEQVAGYVGRRAASPFTMNVVCRVVADVN